MYYLARIPNKGRITELHNSLVPASFSFEHNIAETMPSDHGPGEASKEVEANARRHIWSIFCMREKTQHPRFDDQQALSMQPL